ncbi:hypothetical protein [Actinomycetospora chiangmaiensis]|nr:hypothetical protein [Actinomycetospora chiangmaiensis]
MTTQSDPPPNDDADDRSLDTVPADQDPSDDREAADPAPTGER